MSGTLMMGQAVMVKQSEAEKNVAWESAQTAMHVQAATAAATAAAAAKAGLPGCKVSLGRLTRSRAASRRLLLPQLLSSFLSLPSPV